MPIFPRKRNNNFNQNITPLPYYPNGFFNYNIPYNQNYEQYSQAVDDMIKRNIQAENLNKNFSSLSNPSDLFDLSSLSDEKKSQISKKLGVFITNERNSFLFYEYLRGICPSPNCRAVLKKISDDCSFAQIFYSDFYRKCFENEFCIKKSNINENVAFFDGLLWAVEEESNSIIAISDFIELIPQNLYNNINIIIARKSARIGYLFYILNSFDKKN